MVSDRSSGPPRSTTGGGPAGGPRRRIRPEVDRLTVGKLIDHGQARHEFHPKGPPSYYVKILTDGGAITLWGGKPLEHAFQRSKTQPQLDDMVGVRENNLDPVSFVTRTRNKQGVVIATSQVDTPRPRFVVEKLQEFDLQAAAARTLRDKTISRREAVMNYRELAGAYWILDTGQKRAVERWPDNPQTRERFLQELRETLASTIERGIELPAPKAAQDSRSVATPEMSANAARTLE